ncbi:serine--tRNA ligase [Candidatus Peregrinibacteria bacterium CG10_big_fil_rev_8_21_14_0_10_55_24]|nr:MAG: serine--tRNA ligase [Candidatus Peregrinibacteria bacterium CG10_big_fil_rev_8_21_14_0_10_55_24]
MIDLSDLKKRPKAYAKAAKDKGIAVDIDAFLKLDEERRVLIAEVEGARAEKNVVSKKVPTLKGKEKEETIAAMQKLSGALKEKEEALQGVEERWRETQLLFPTIPHESVPVGKTDKENVEASRHGKVPTFAFEPKDHVTLGEALDIIDIPRGVKLAGARSYFLKGDGARLHRAVLQLALDHLTTKGWVHFTPPYLASYDCLMGTGFFPGAEEQTYAVGAQEKRGDAITPDDLYLIGTSEVSVASYHKDEVLKESELPKRYAGYSPCFRREAGTYGKDTKGLYRIHQFDKVEQVVLCRADEEEGMALFEEIRTNAEEVLQQLELPYRVMTVCTGDMGKGKVFMQDIETYMPSRSGYGETHSCSYLGDFQARRLNIKYQTESGEKLFVHTLNNTCIASPRILIPILEIYQNKDSTVTVPEILRPYMGGQDLIVPR